jgi:acyl-CoA hydrolase
MLLICAFAFLLVVVKFCRIVLRASMGSPKYANQSKTGKQMTTEERIQQSETRIFKAVFPNTTNHYDTLFGGTAMQLMDEVAFISATRFSRQRMVTVSSDRIDFKRPIPAGTIVELIGKVSYLGSTSLKVHVDIFIEQMYAEGREKAVSGDFTFVAIDEEKNPVKILK